MTPGFIKLRKDLLTDPSFIFLSSRVFESLRGHFGTNWTVPTAQSLTLGALLRLWVYADEHIGENDIIRITSEEFDYTVGIPGFCSMMPKKWMLIQDDGYLKLPNYQRDNGSYRQRKADEAEKKRRQREAKKNGCPVMSPQRPDLSLNVPPQNRTDKEKEREANASPKKAAQMRLIEAELTPGLNPVAWKTWIEYRREIHKPLHAASVVKAAESMAALGSHAEQLDAVEFTMSQGYQGLVQRKGQGTGTARAWTTRPTQESALAAIEAAQRESTTERSDDDGYIHLE